MKRSETQTERLAWLIRERSFLTVTNSSMSGWSSLSISIKAPRRLPPCWITSPVATEYSSAQEQGPEAVPLTVVM